MAKVLLVDDDSSIRTLYGDQFERHGFEVKVVHDGREALTELSKSKPDVVLLDMMMPQMDGMGFLKELRDSPHSYNIPVIILTNLEPTDIVLQGILKYKPAYYMLKFNTAPQDIVQKINDVLQVN